MSIKKKILIAALALGTVVGFGSGFAKMHMMKCHRGGWEAHGHHSSPCQRWEGRHHNSRRDYQPPPEPPCSRRGFQ